MDFFRSGNAVEIGRKHEENKEIKTFLLFGDKVAANDNRISDLDMKIAKSIIGEVERVEDVYIHDFISPKDAEIIGEQLFQMEILRFTAFKNNMFSTIFPMTTTTLEALTIINTNGSTSNADTIDDTYFANIRKVIDQNQGLVELNVDKLSTLHGTEIIKKNKNRAHLKFNYSDQTHLNLYMHLEDDTITMAVNSWQQLLAMNKRETKEKYITIIAESPNVFQYRFPFFTRCSGEVLSLTSTKNVDTFESFVALSKRMRDSKWTAIKVQSSIDYSDPASCIEMGEKIKKVRENMLFVGRVDIHFPNRPRLPLPLSLHARLICGIDSENSYRADLKNNTVTCFIKRKHDYDEILYPAVIPATTGAE